MSFTPDQQNTIFALAADFIRHTGQHLFLTGKAGTGKTTFLRYIRDHCHKKAVVAAPTGVAAINAGGVTLHSLFQLPFGPYIPGSAPHAAAIDRHQLMKQVRLSSAKREVLQELELLIIDEVSMLRCDMLDACDQILRSVRKRPSETFGGVQVLFIGDLFQLPPVVVGEEWELLRNYYEGPFFFNAKVIAEAPPVQLELKKIYRQNEQHFIDILNRIRNADPLPEDLDQLNRRFVPESEFPAQTITLTTHNRKADQLNTAGLEALPGKRFSFEAVIENEFNENAYPTEKTLHLKPGAQVMFIKNDTGENRRWFNGKLAVVTRITEEEIEVLPDGSQTPLKVEKETWRNIRYQLNKEKDRLEEEELGSFTQYPLRLAWAITIHKSQGLTFEKAVIDTGQAFSPGQVYVALSRCTTLEGIYLLSKIFRSAIQTHPQVIAFAAREADENALLPLLETARKQFSRQQLVALFNWTSVEKQVRDCMLSISEKEFSGKDQGELVLSAMLNKVAVQQKVADKFRDSLDSLLEPEAIASGLLQERMEKAVNWFADALHNELILPLDHYRQSLKGKTRIGKIVAGFGALQADLWNKLEQLQQRSFPDLGYAGLTSPRYTRVPEPEMPEKKRKTGKPTRGDSARETLDAFREGMDIEAIAKKRGITPGTVRQHLMSLIPSGEIKASQLMDTHKIDMVVEEAPKLPSEGLLSALKNKFGDLLSWDEIRIGLYHLQYLNTSNRTDK